MLADKCAACLTCLRVCPFDIPVVTDIARIESRLCQACGICIAECPANAIIARGREPGELIDRTRAALARLPAGRPRVVAYLAGYHATGADWRGEGEPVDGVAEIVLPSTARLSAAELLHAFEAGADAVIVVCCPDGTERYPYTAERTRRRVDQARRMLVEAGLNGDALQLLAAADEPRSALRTALAEAAAKADAT